MKIHNLLEEIVIQKVHEIFNEEEQNPVLGFCTCEQCRLDVACYVLNRTNPEYAVSGRGFAHMKAEYDEDSQKIADITALIMEGIKKVSRSKRPFFPHTEGKPEESSDQPHYNYPIIAGRFFDGKTFEPVSDIDVLLTSEEKQVLMKNPNWQNPYHIAHSTAGNFMFWPEPLPAKKPGLKKSVNFKISTRSEAYEVLTHIFTIRITSGNERIDTFNLNENYLLEDLYLFRRADNEDIAGAET